MTGAVVNVVAVASVDTIGGARQLYDVEIRVVIEVSDQKRALLLTAQEPIRIRNPFKNA